MKLLAIVLVPVILAGGIALEACQPVASPLEDYSWELVTYGQPGGLQSVLPNTKVTALFSSKDKVVSGSGGVNDYSGKYTVERLTITITGLQATAKASVDPAVNAQETHFLRFSKAPGALRWTTGT